MWLWKIASHFAGFSGGAIMVNLVNQAALSLPKDNILNDSTKQIKVKYHYVRSVVSPVHVTLQYLPTQRNVADAFTKAPGRTKLQKHVQEM